MTYRLVVSLRRALRFVEREDRRLVAVLVEHLDRRTVVLARLRADLAHRAAAGGVADQRGDLPADAPCCRR